MPETDIVSILITYGLLGPVMAVFRPLAAVLTAMVTGTLINLIERLERRRAEAAQDQAQGDECRRQTISHGIVHQRAANAADSAWP